MPDGSVREHRAGQVDLPEGMSKVLAAIEKDHAFMFGAPVGAQS
jgi:hypothetical protein